MFRNRHDLWQKKILTIGFEVCSDEVQYCAFNSDISLLDWDIIAFKPDISEFISYTDMYLGKPCLSDSLSFKLKERVEHWRREIKDAFESGKSVFVYLSDLTELYIATGEKQYSGTGRNQKTTRMVTEYNNYRSIPANISPISTKGKKIKLSPKYSKVISSYWQRFSSILSYKVIINNDISPCLITTNGNKTVGTIYRSKNSQGALFLLPDIDFYSDDFLDGEEWSSAAEQFASKFIKEIVSINKSIKNTGELTPEPEWAKIENYKLEAELKLSSALLKVENRLENIQAKKEILSEQLKDAGRLRNLLFEKGKPLEYAILDALKIIGFDVSQYDDGKSEFDAVFKSKEGRLIGEAEGKDSKSINIDKLRHLALNVHEDLERDEITIPAKSVLFGNAFRLKPLSERDDPFTTKCQSASQTSSTALVFTPDLFFIAKYLSGKKDARFAKKCREALLQTIGRVEFPLVPMKKDKSDSNAIKHNKANSADAKSRAAD